MEPLDRLLDRAKSVTGSDYATAKRLGITDSAISQWRNRPKSAPDPERAFALADLLGLDPVEVLAVCEAKRARDEDARKRWIARAGKAIAAGMGGAIVTGTALLGAGAEYGRLLIMSTSRRERATLPAIG